MTPQALLKARFSELAESMGVGLSVRRQAGKFYFAVAAPWTVRSQFIERSIPGAWMTSGSGAEAVYGLPLEEVERILANLQVGPAWLAQNDSVARLLAERIRAEEAFDLLPILADALQEGGCDNAEILEHCRAIAPHRHTCWVIELMLGPARQRRSKTRDETPGRRS